MALLSLIGLRAMEGSDVILGSADSKGSEKLGDRAHARLRFRVIIASI
jgi:hypothetical protein